MAASTRSATPRRVTATQPWWRDKTTVVVATVLAALLAVGVTVVLLVSRDDDQTVPAAAASAGVTGGDFHSLAADPTTAGLLYVGGHQAVSMSDDAGSTWHRLDALDNADAMGWGFESGTTWISGHPGIVVSSDNGATAAPRNDALPDTDIHALGVSDGVIFGAGPNVGVIASDDDGASWQTVTSTAGHSFFGRILVDGDDPAHLLAADAAQGPVVSTDGGATWDVLTAFPVTWISATDGLDTVYASGPEGAIVSDDSGATWNELAVPPGATLVELDPHEPGRTYAGVHDGERVTVYVSDDRGADWRPAPRSR